MKYLRKLLVLTALLTSALAVRAQNIVISFDTNSIFALGATNGVNSNELSACAWHWWGSATTVHTYDPNEDAGGDPTSGSIKITATWPASGGDQYSVGLALSGAGQYDTGVLLAAGSYTNMEIDIKWDPASTIPIGDHMIGGDPTGWGFGFIATQYGQSWVPNANQPVLVNDGQWHHYVIPIDPAWPDIPGVIFKKFKGANAADANTTSAFWVDNIKFNFNTNQVIPHPTLTIAKAVKGLNITAARAGDQYQRETVRSKPADSIWWYGQSYPVKYSWTISEFPSRAVAPGYFGVMFLATDGSSSMTPDWNDPNCINIETSLNGANQGTCTFRFKTNAPNDNGVLYGVGSLGTLTDPSGVLGTWSATFSNNSVCTLVGPSGASLTVDMGPDAALYFNPSANMETHFGFQPGGPANIGFRATYSEIKVETNGVAVFDDTFPLEDPVNGADPALWINAYQAGDIAGKLVDHDGAYWLDWNKPDGFLSGLLISSDLSTGWVDPGLAILDHGTRRAMFADTNTLSAYQPTAYFKLFSTNAP